jgi:S1-C subfamily serine protease
MTRALSLAGPSRGRLRLRTTLLAACVVAMVLPQAALALGGQATGTAGSWMQRHAIMVHSDRGGTCSGVVIAPTVVMTAAHCVSGAKRYAVSYREGDSPQLQAVASVARNPGYSRSQKVSTDIALLRLQVPLPSRFQPVELIEATASSLRPPVGASLTLVGFGMSRDRDETSMGTLRQAEVEVLPRHFPRFLRLGRSSDDLLICRGDSGGAVLDGSVLAGIIYASENPSRGSMCGKRAQAIRIAPQRQWIDGILAQWGVR